MDKKKFEDLLRKSDPNLVEKVDFTLGPVSGQINEVLNWSEALNKILSKSNLKKVELSQEDIYWLNELKLFLKYSIDCHIEARFKIKIKQGKGVFYLN